MAATISYRPKWLYLMMRPSQSKGRHAPPFPGIRRAQIGCQYKYQPHHDNQQFTMPHMQDMNACQSSPSMSVRLVAVALRHFRRSFAAQRPPRHLRNSTPRPLRLPNKSFFLHEETSFWGSLPASQFFCYANVFRYIDAPGHAVYVVSQQNKASFIRCASLYRRFLPLAAKCILSSVHFSPMEDSFRGRTESCRISSR